MLEDRILKMDAALAWSTGKPQPKDSCPLELLLQAPGLTELKWSREDRIPDFIAGAMKVVSDVSAIVDIMKA